MIADAIILAGGSGSRLRPFDKIIPKALLPYRNGTLLSHIIDHLARQGVQRVYITVGNFGWMLKSYVEQLSLSGIQISWIHESEPAGNGGALAALSHVSERALVLNCDVYSQVHMQELLAIHLSREALMTIVVKKNVSQLDVGVIEFEPSNLITSYREKPAIEYYQNCGVYLIDKRVLSFIDGIRPLSLDSLIERLLSGHERLAVYNYEGPYEHFSSIPDVLKNGA